MNEKINLEQPPRSAEQGEMPDPVIAQILREEPLLQGKQWTVQKAEHGVSSQVVIIETGSEKYVLKVGNCNPLLDSYFFDCWKSAGVLTPEVRAVGGDHDTPYLLMNYVDAPVVEDLLAEGQVTLEQCYRELGALLAQLHTIPANGFGGLEQNTAGAWIPKHTTFRSWLAGGHVEKQLDYTLEQGLLNVEPAALTTACTILAERNEDQSHSVYGHNDLSLDNLLATTPRTVIDPYPMLVDGLMDVARSILLSSRYPKAGGDIVRGYMEAGAPVTEDALHAALVVRACLSAPYLHKAKRFERLNQWCDCLERRHLP